MTAQPSEREARAREVLAQMVEQDDMPGVARHIREGRHVSVAAHIAIRAARELADRERADEREACAMVAEGSEDIKSPLDDAKTDYTGTSWQSESTYDVARSDAAAAIRNRKDER